MSHSLRYASILSLVLGLALSASPASAQTTYSNFGTVTLPNSASNNQPGSPYPSSIAVSGLSGMVTKATITLHNLSHTFPDDLDFLVVSPTGAKLVLMSDTGGGSANALSNVTLTFDDAAATSLPDSTQITSGTYKPTNVGGSDTFSSPAPAGPYASTLATFNGADPNGTWKLYAMDDTQEDGGSFGGWSVTLTTEDAGSPSAVPEPASLALFAPALGVLGLLQRRRGKSRH